MDLRQMTAFVAVYECGSISRAAHRLDVAQPSVSNLIRNLEDELDIKFFERLARGTKPTPIGETFYHHCQKVLAEADSARKAVTGGLDHVGGPVNVGLAPTAAKGLLPKFLARYLDDYPEVEVQVVEAFSGPLTEWTLSGQVDFAVVAVPSIDRRLSIRRIASEPIVLVMSLEQAQKYDQSARPAKRQPLKLVLPSPRNGLRTTLDGYIHSNNLAVARTIEIDSLHGMLEFVRCSDWVTILPVTAIINELEHGDIAVRLIDPPMELGFYLIHLAQRALSPAATQFVERLETSFKASIEDWLPRLPL